MIPLFDLIATCYKNKDNDSMLNRTIQIKIDKAIRLLQNNSEEALKIFNEILKNEPDNIDALNGKGSALMKLNRFDDAEKCFDKSLSISENIAALINKGIILKSKKDYQNAIYYFNKAIEMDFEMNTILSIFKNEIFEQIDINSLHKSFNKKAMMYIKKGLNYKNKYKLWEAIACFEKAISEDEQCKNVVNAFIKEIDYSIFNEFLFEIPVCKKTEEDKLKIQALKELLINENPEKALKLLNQLLEINQNDISTLNYKACILFLSSKYNDSIDCFNECLELNQDYKYALFNKGLVLRRTNRLNESLNCFNRFLENEKNYIKTKPYQIEIIEKINENNEKNY